MLANATEPPTGLLKQSYRQSRWQPTNLGAGERTIVAATATGTGQLRRCVGQVTEEHFLWADLV